MTPHYLAKLLRARSERRRAEAGYFPVSLADVPDDEIIDLWNDTDAYSDQEKLTGRQLRIAIARSESVGDFLRFCRCLALVDGSYLLFRPGQSAVLRTLLDTRYFVPPDRICALIEIAAAENDYGRYQSFQRIIARRCERFFERHWVAEFDILVSYGC